MNASYFWRYWQGGNKWVALAYPICVFVVLWNYENVASYARVLNIKVDLLLSYSFNLLAVSLGALVSLFALLASRPTEFLIRIRNTTTFKLLISNIKITMLFCGLVILVNGVIGVMSIEPSQGLGLNSFLFVVWFSLFVATVGFIVRTVRSIFMALT